MGTLSRIENSARRTKPSRRSREGQGRARPLTELDYNVLGVVWRDGPLTAYAVRGRFASSVTAAWSASTGSIYPSIRRLLGRGLIRASEHRDARRTQELSVSPRGLAAMRTWLLAVPAGLAGNVADPIRTRVQFLGVLGSREVAGFLAEAEADCRSALKNVDGLLSRRRRGPDPGRAWALMGARHELHARLQWIGWVRRRAAAASRPARRARPRGNARKGGGSE